jgi:hypothetical protein
MYWIVFPLSGKNRSRFNRKYTLCFWLYQSERNFKIYKYLWHHFQIISNFHLKGIFNVNSVLDLITVTEILNHIKFPFIKYIPLLFLNYIPLLFFPDGKGNTIQYIFFKEKLRSLVWTISEVRNYFSFYFYNISISIIKYL